MAALNDKVKAFIVQSLACFDTPQQVARAVKQEFDIDVERQQVAAYDPTKSQGRNLSEKWRKYFAECRETFKSQIEDIPIANKSYRLRSLGRMSEKLEERGNLLGAATLLKQAAEDAGGVYTNRKEITGAGGQPLNPAPPVSTDEYLAAREQVKDEY